MPTSVEQLMQWLSEPEGVRLEFKEAKSRYDFDKLVQYCVALAHEGGGKIILGVTDRRPRQIVGTGLISWMISSNALEKAWLLKNINKNKDL